MVKKKGTALLVVFADIDAKTWCLTAETMARCITERTKAVIPVDLYGNMAEMDGICELAERHGIAVIEDAAEAIGSRYKGRAAGAFGIARSVFVFASILGRGLRFFTIAILVWLYTTHRWHRSSLFEELEAERGEEFYEDTESEYGHGDEF